RIRSNRYLVPTNRHGGECGDFFVRATCDSIAGARDATPRKLSVSASGARTLEIPAAASPRYGHQRHRRLVALDPSSIAHCSQTLARDGVHGGITGVATDRFPLHGQLLIAISDAFGREALRVSSGGQHG